MPIGLPQLGWMMRAALGLKTAAMGLKAPAGIMRATGLRAGARLAKGYRTIKVPRATLRSPIVRKAIYQTLQKTGLEATRMLGQGARQAWGQTSLGSRRLLMGGGAGVAAGAGALGARRRRRRLY